MSVWFANAILRAGGWIVMFDFEFGCDESGSHEGSPVLCLAGYVLNKQQMSDFDREWNEVLSWQELPHVLPYFHMSDCAPDPGNGPFRGLTKKQRIQVVARLMAVIKRRTV